MKRFLFATTAVLALATTPAMADIYDPLQLNCSSCGAGTGSFIPVGGTVTGLQVFSAPSQQNSYDLQLKILVPTDYGSSFSFTASGTSSGSFGLFSSSPFVTGVNGQNNPSLEADYLLETLAGGSPPNSLNTLLDQSTLFDPLATGYFVFLFDAGNYLLKNQGAGPSPVNIDIAGALPAGSWVLGDLFTPGGVVTTATSEGLVSVPGPIAGAGIPGLISAVLGMVGLNRFRRRRKVV